MVPPTAAREYAGVGLLLGGGAGGAGGGGEGGGSLPLHLLAGWRVYSTTSAPTSGAPGFWSWFRNQVYDAALAFRKVRPAKPKEGSRYALQVGCELWQ